MIKAGDTVIDFMALLRKRQEEWAETACKGEEKNLALCSDENATTCPMRQMLTCPRRVTADRAEKRRVARESAADRGVPERVLRDAYDRDPEERPVLQEVAAFMRSDASVLLLCGPTACGKTTAAGWACLPPWDAPWEPLPRRRGVPRGRFVTAAELADPTLELVEELKSYDLVVIDDIGGAYFGERGYQVGVIAAVVDHFYAECKKIILTTDLSPKQATALLGDRIMTRVRRGGVTKGKGR